MSLCALCHNNSGIFFGDMGCRAHQWTKMEDGVKQSRARVCMSQSKEMRAMPELDIGV